MFKYNPDNKLPAISIPEDRLINLKNVNKKTFFEAEKSHKENVVNRIKNSGLNIDNDRVKIIQERQKNDNNPLELKP